MRTLSRLLSATTAPKPIAFLVLLALVLSLIAPVAEQVAAQADLSEEDATEEPLEESTAVPEETPEVDLEPTEAVAPATSQLTIDVFRCDHPDYDTGFSENIQRVLSECTGPGSAFFTIESGNGQQEGSGGNLSFEIQGFLNLIESIPAGYDNPIADCFLMDANGNQYDRIGPSEASGGYWKVGSIGGDVHCNWYQVDRGVGNVYVVNMGCPSTAGLFPEPSMTDLIAMCTEPAGSKQFFVVHSGGLERMVPSGGEFNDAFFEAIPAGPIEIWMDDPGIFESARVFCQVNTIDGIEIAPFAEVGVGGFRTSGLTLGHGQRLHCSWFNIEQGPGLDPGDDTTPVPTVPPTQQLSELIIKKYTCPANYDPEAANADPFTDCEAGPNGVNFTLVDTDPNTVDLQTMTGDSIPNAVKFGGLPPGDYTITETVPPRTDEIFLLGCGGGGVGPVPFFIDGTTTIGLTQGVIMTCPWFNIPKPGGGQGTERIGTPESSPAVIAAIDGTASLTIAAYACPAGFDVNTVDANPQAQCAPLPGISFDIMDSVDDNSGRFTETDATGMGTVVDLAEDAYTIEAGARNGTTSSFYWDCYDAAGASTRIDPLKVGENLQIEIADGAQVRCDWFAVTGGTARVVISKHACDYLVPAYTLDQAGLSAQCTIDTGTVNMTVVSDTHQETLPASNNPLTLASFANVPTGQVAVVEENIPGWASAIVFCGIFDENGGVVSSVSKMNVIQGRSIFLQLEPGQVASCDWYNVAQGFVKVTVNKHLCPEGFDAYAASPNDLALGCTQDPGSVKFSLHDESLFYEERTITAAAPGVWTNVPSGDIRIDEQALPTGFGLPIVICTIDFENGTNVSPAQPVTVTNGSYAGWVSIFHTLSAGQVMTCDWYNVPGGHGAVSIWKQACPPDVNVASMTAHELEQTCQEEIPEITFDLTVTTTVGTFTDSATSTNAFRYADFPAIPRGEVTITERPVSPWDHAVVYCSIQSETKPNVYDVLVPVSETGSITQFIDSGDRMVCRWYNAYEPKSIVEIYKYTCPEGTGYEEDDAWYLQNCSTPSKDGIEFMLTSSEGIGIGYTAGGKVLFENVAIGPFSIQERIPEEFGQPIVFCGFDPAAPTDVNKVDSTNGYVSAVFDGPGQRFVCYWYNIPGKAPDLTIYKYWCPAGYDYTAMNADPASECTEKANGITFNLEGPGEHPNSATTGDPLDGAVKFEKLEAGTYVVTEVVPDNTYVTFVWNCVGQVQGELRPTPLSVGERLEITLSRGESVICYWYNVPRELKGKVTVYKYTCSTRTYVSDIDCEIQENPVTFDLVMWDGDSWVKLDTKQTDGGGKITWGGLDPGAYWLDEQPGDWCHMTSAQMSEDGNWIDVYDGEETVIAVYNCEGKPGKPGATPKKYPNTGVPPITYPDRRTP